VPIFPAHGCIEIRPSLLLLAWHEGGARLQWRKAASRARSTSTAPSVSSILGYMNLALVAAACCSEYPLHITVSSYCYYWSRYKRYGMWFRYHVRLRYL
jgi:hypothetical protein